LSALKDLDAFFAEIAVRRESTFLRFFASKLMPPATPAGLEVRLNYAIF
jgi:hypothetical protein